MASPAKRQDIIQVTYRKPVTEATGKQLSAAIISSQEKKPSAILLILDSSGGDLAVGWSLIKQIRESPIPIHCIVDGNASSVAFLMLQSCATRAMTPESTLMAHQPMVVLGRDGEVMLTARNLEDLMVDLKASAERMAVMCSARMKMPLEEFQKNTDGIDWVMASATALKENAVDHVSSVAEARFRLASLPAAK